MGQQRQRREEQRGRPSLDAAIQLFDLRLGEFDPRTPNEHRCLFDAEAEVRNPQLGGVAPRRQPLAGEQRSPPTREDEL